MNKYEVIFLMMVCVCISLAGYLTGYEMDNSLQEHMRYLETCTEGLEGLSDIDIVFCHQYDIAMRTTR